MTSKVLEKKKKAVNAYLIKNSKGEVGKKKEKKKEQNSQAVGRTRRSYVGA